MSTATMPTVPEPAETDPAAADTAPAVSAGATQAVEIAQAVEADDAAETIPELSPAGVVAAVRRAPRPAPPARSS